MNRLTPPTRTYLRLPEHIPERARFPVVDAHNHLWANWAGVGRIVRIMDRCNLVAYCDLTANVKLSWVKGGYQFCEGRFESFLQNAAIKAPGQFYGFTTATFTRPITAPLFTDARRFVEETLSILRAHADLGARGLKILKELGLHYRDGRGRRIFPDDSRLAPVWEECARLGLPVLIHQADPYGFFEPATPDNEHYGSLRKYPSWRFEGRRYPSFALLQKHYRNLVRGNPRTTFILPHCANWPENLAYVAEWLEECPNAHIDISARIDELGRQPYTAREFMIRYDSQILFGTDMPASEAVYRCYFRFLETYDENFEPPDYDGTFRRFRWRIHGLGLPDRTLRKIYYGNALKLIPGLKNDIGARIIGTGNLKRR